MANFQSCWLVTGSGDNAVATAEKAGVSDKTHFITHVSASFSVAKIKLLQLKNGVDVIWEGYVHNAVAHDFPTPIVITTGNATSAVLAAGGTAGEIGKVNLGGFTV